MKTLAVRLDDEVMELLTVVSQLEGTTLIDQIRTAIGAHLERKVQGGELAAQAESALADIDKEAADRKAAISSLLGSATPAKASGSRRRSSPAAEGGEEPAGNPVGFRAPRGGKGPQGK